MYNNLFAPPRALVADAQTAPSDATKPKSVWLLQGVLALLLVSLSWALLATVMSVSRMASSDWLFSVPYCACLGLLVAGLVLTVRGCQRRRPYGRWLGMLWIATLFAIQAFRSARGIAAGVLADQSQEVIAQAMAGALMLSVIGFWLYRFGLSARSRAWFGTRPAQ